MMKSVPPFAIVAGNPGRVVGWRKRPEAMAADPQPPRIAANEE
jgi:acetyltransferase-like isoleucine patch superfamily enzyme